LFILCFLFSCTVLPGPESAEEGGGGRRKIKMSGKGYEE
jgi:hypothetical protein